MTFFSECSLPPMMTSLKSKFSGALPKIPKLKSLKDYLRNKENYFTLTA